LSDWRRGVWREQARVCRNSTPIADRVEEKLGGGNHRTQEELKKGRGRCAWGKRRGDERKR
jgi:hypothetical protein